ncbi:hypothetical protein [Porphyromonas loveana]|uniref:YD repeat-containing protein n=1 Tax=Porphyromonas loveana TaxID=1884669 RepID=A0A2U1F6J0_9PORP|nr:hypothetical protein [Porphyromonas loveana]PVZ07805.1 YD repeat-containing protein [Porphyromonas loveana]
MIRLANVQFAGQLSAGYELDYAYRGEAGSRFRLDTLRDRHYCVEGTPVAGDEERHAYSYDARGNLTGVRTVRLRSDGAIDADMRHRRLR